MACCLIQHITHSLLNNNGKGPPNCRIRLEWGSYSGEGSHWILSQGARSLFITAHHHAHTASCLPASLPHHWGNEWGELWAGKGGRRTHASHNNGLRQGILSSSQCSVWETGKVGVYHHCTLGWHGNRRLPLHNTLVMSHWVKWPHIKRRHTSEPSLACIAHRELPLSLEYGVGRLLIHTHDSQPPHNGMGQATGGEWHSMGQYTVGWSQTCFCPSTHMPLFFWSHSLT